MTVRRDPYPRHTLDARCTSERRITSGAATEDPGAA
jgi:hypothetical protein